ncbi:AidA/PixA family protein [Tenacibaculum agarivorans]|uniref:AidA/PixA family protein n=1 Tax=Tenacibaculum agarivorans TaxID=1908389 RepID=UPI00094B9C0F|nr:AidA/PixA family protein [Tenacibaculum agarivorans]
MPNTINILSVIDVETILSSGITRGTKEVPTLLGSWGQSDSYVYMITAQGFVDSNSTTRAGSELTIDANVGDTIQWELTCPGSGLQFNAIISGIGVNSNSHSLSTPAATLTTRHIYTEAGKPGYQIVQQTDFVSSVVANGTAQYTVTFQIMSNEGVSLGYYYWDPFVKVLDSETYKAAKAEALKKGELV